MSIPSLFVVLSRGALLVVSVGVPLLLAARPGDSQSADAQAVEALDIQFQGAVKRNDAVTMGRILARDYILVSGRGSVQTKADLLKEAAEGQFIYEHQEDDRRTVRVWGDTAVITALLWAKGTREGKPFDYHIWFSDVYMRRPEGWRYVFAQVAQPLPPSP